MRLRGFHRVIPVLAGLALILVWALDFAGVQPNRIVPATGFPLLSAIGGGLSAFYLVGLALLIILPSLPWRMPVVKTIRTVIDVLAILLLAGLPLSLAHFSRLHLSPDQPFARVEVGAGFWCLLFFLLLIMIEVLRDKGTWRRLMTAAVVLVVWFYDVRTGALDALSLIREYHNRSDQFATVLEQHLALSLGSVGVSLVVSFFLAVAMTRRPRWQRPVFALVNFVQTIPSLALFGLLIAPLSYLSAHSTLLRDLGIRGIGWAPAALALVAYSLLPMVRNTFVALTEIPADLLEAGRGMGMSESQLFRQIKWPLALPVIIEGVRVTTIQAIGLTAVAALIGAGGLGTFIFQGLGQAAMDLVLLGALPTIGLALLADLLFSWLARHWRVIPEITS
ncbi:ABC transporter permease [Mangrovitalea sediminis]|uniref:ABC transporter permease n=1 Tax=Mangrovitalea sediminis TaxID=1982043 RepID=UPI0018EA0FCB|nr:ABC transporter permease [Mangrovitalea sediminis]